MIYKQSSILIHDRLVLQTANKYIINISVSKAASSWDGQLWVI